MTKTFFICRIALAGFLIASPAPATPATAAMIAEAQAALDKGDAPHAISLADSAMSEAGVTPAERGGLLLCRGLARELLGSHQDAMVDFTAALQIRALPRDEREQALLQRGFLLDGLGRLGDAAADYSAVIALKGPSIATALNNRANIYRRQKRPVDARRDYLASLAQQNTRPQYSYYGLGQLAEGQGDRLAARGFYVRAVAADPDYLLASERLTALVGSPDASSGMGFGAVAADSSPLVLRPIAARGYSRTATPALSQPARRDPERIVLRPPMSRALGLRPALDAPSTKVEVQLGAWRSAPEAQAGWKRAQAKVGKALDGLAAHIVVADLPGKGRYYRLRTGATDPARLCSVLKGRGLDCLRPRD